MAGLWRRGEISSSSFPCWGGLGEGEVVHVDLGFDFCPCLCPILASLRT